MLSKGRCSFAKAIWSQRQTSDGLNYCREWEPGCRRPQHEPRPAPAAPPPAARLLHSPWDLNPIFALTTARLFNHSITPPERLNRRAPSPREIWSLQASTASRCELYAAFERDRSCPKSHRDTGRHRRVSETGVRAPQASHRCADALLESLNHIADAAGRQGCQRQAAVERPRRRARAVRALLCSWLQAPTVSAQQVRSTSRREGHQLPGFMQAAASDTSCSLQNPNAHKCTPATDYMCCCHSPAPAASKCTSCSRRARGPT